MRWRSPSGRLRATGAGWTAASVAASVSASVSASGATSSLDTHTLFSAGAASVPGALDFAALRASVETPAVMEAFANIEPDDHAKYLLTSGSTGTPKVVINTHRMPCANQQMISSCPAATSSRCV